MAGLEGERLLGLWITSADEEGVRFAQTVTKERIILHVRRGSGLSIITLSAPGAAASRATPECVKRLAVLLHDADLRKREETPAVLWERGMPRSPARSRSIPLSGGSLKPGTS